jgi:pimeloyl-ACP methyl ester carboxylesterase
VARITHGDLVVVLPGILGSTLYRGDRQVWGYRQLFTGVTGLRRLTDRLTADLSLSTDAFDHPEHGIEDGVVARAPLTTQGIIPGLVTIDGYDDLLTTLRVRFHDDLADDPDTFVAFPYDWRQSNEYTARLVQAQVEPLLERRRQPYPDARIVFVAHSMGGLVARYYAHVLDEKQLTRRIVTIGTPYQGAVKALAVLANGQAKLGPFTVQLGDLVRSLPSVAELLPVYPCLGPTPDALTRLATTLVPGLPDTCLRRCLTFHQRLDQAITDHPDRRPTYHALLSHRQPTDVWASLHPTTPAGVGAGGTAADAGTRTDTRVVAHRPTDFADRGDGTVPRRSATPPEWDDDAAALFLAGTHAALQQTTETYRQLAGILTTTPRPRAAAIDEIAADLPELTAPGEPWTAAATSVEGSDRLALSLTITNPDTGTTIVERPLRPAGNATYTTKITLSDPGLYRWTIHTPPTAKTPIDPISDLVLTTPE